MKLNHILSIDLKTRMEFVSHALDGTHLDENDNLDKINMDETFHID
jgi:hypothetical protein